MFLRASCCTGFYCLCFPGPGQQFTTIGIFPFRLWPQFFLLCTPCISKWLEMLRAETNYLLSWAKWAGFISHLDTCNNRDLSICFFLSCVFSSAYCQKRAFLRFW